MRIATILGARPQFIKAAAVSRVLRERGDTEEFLIHTGQHYDASMSEVFFDELDVPHPSYRLDVGSGSHGRQTGRMLESLEAPLQQINPDCVVVYGDTNSTLAGALVAAKMHIPVVHVEAGLRSFNRRMPEEINRVACDHMSDLLFATTMTAVNHLRNEGIQGDCVHMVGDVMFDATRFYLKRDGGNRQILQQLGLEKKNYVLATIHRAENVDDPARLSAIVEGLQRLARISPVVIPLHPRTKAAAERCGLLPRIRHSLKCIEPVGYLDMLRLEESARLIATDSGGVQKEAFFVRVPCLTMRTETEWTELVEQGWNRLISATDLPSLDRIAVDWINRVEQRADSDRALFGDGEAAVRIGEILRDKFARRQAA